MHQTTTDLQRRAFRPDSKGPQKRASRKRRIGGLVLLVAVIALIIGLRPYWHRAAPIADAIVGIDSAADLPALDPPGRAQKVVIFAPHPDDESLGCGGFIQRAVDAGAQVRVVVVTNGEYSETDIDHLDEPPAERPQSYEAFGTIRQQESIMALGLLAVPESSVTFLGYPNHLLEAMWSPDHWLPDTPVFSARLNATRSPYPDSMTRNAVFCGQSMLDDIEAVLLREKPDIVVTIHPNDIHHDHWPTYTYVRFALDELAARGAEFAGRCSVYTYIVHRGPLWPVPKAFEPKLPLSPPSPLVNAWDWRVLPLSDRQTTRKAEAISLYKSQGGDTHPYMRSFARTNDLFAVVGEHDWPAQGDHSESISDARGDLAESALHGSADVVKVTMHKHADRMVVSIRTRQAATPGTTYHFSIHAGGSERADRSLGYYTWRNGKVSLYTLRDGHRSPDTKGDMKSVSSANTSTLDAPWPLAKNARFFIIRGWTSMGGHDVDEAAAASFHIGAGNHEIEKAK